MEVVRGDGSGVSALLAFELYFLLAKRRGLLRYHALTESSKASFFLFSQRRNKAKRAQEWSINSVRGEVMEEAGRRRRPAATT